MRTTFDSLLLQSGKNLADIARETGLSLSHISRIRSGSRRPSVAAAVEIARVIDQPIASVLKVVLEAA